MLNNLKSNRTLWIVLIALGIIGGLYVWTKQGQSKITPSITITSPSAEDSWVTGSSHTISWTTKNIPSTDKISITLRRVPPPDLQTEGQEFDPIVFVNLENNGKTEWKISDMYPTGTYIMGINNYSSIPIENSISAESTPFKISNPKIEAGDTTCYYNSQFLVLYKDADVIGKKFLIKKIIDDGKDITCNYTVEPTDFEIKAEATYFLALENNFLILDIGTSPDPRGLAIYDLNSNKKIYSGLYSKPISVENNNISFWSPTDLSNSKNPIKPTTENCPDLAEYTAGGLGAGIESYTTLNLISLKEKESGEYRCSARQ